MRRHRGASHARARRTGECQLRQNEKIQLIRIRPGQHSVRAIQVVVDVSHLGSELQATDPHRDGLGVPADSPLAHETGDRVSRAEPLPALVALEVRAMAAA